MVMVSSQKLDIKYFNCILTKLAIIHRVCLQTCSIAAPTNSHFNTHTHMFTIATHGAGNEMNSTFRSLHKAAIAKTSHTELVHVVFRVHNDTWCVVSGKHMSFNG